MEESIELKVDYISQLPEPILHHILSFLSTTQIIQTSVLSKTWYQTWTTFQILEFDFYALFRRNQAYYYTLESMEIRNRRMQELYNFVENILLNRHKQLISFKKFTVIMPSVYQEPETVSTLDRWLGYAIDCHVKDLKVVVGPFNNDEEYKYDLPPSVLTNGRSSIRVLYLENCKLKLPISCGRVNLPCLKKLYFRTVWVNDDLISNLISGSPEIEDLTLISCYGIKTLHLFSGLVKLTKVELESLDELERLHIDAPNLQSINLTAESWPYEVNIAASCKKLNKLQINHSPITDKWLHHQLKQLPLLKYLCLFHCSLLESIKISNSNLHTLYIGTCKKLVQVNINTPCLQIFSYTGDIISFSSNDLVLPEATLHFSASNMNNSWYTNLIDLLAKFNHCFQALNLGSETGKCYIVPRELREVLVPPLFKLKELNLSISVPRKSYPIAELVDAMLWISPHLKSLSIETMTKCSFKFSYQNGGETTVCYKYVPVSCWRNCMKTVKIKQISYDRNTKETEERSYLFNEDIWDKIEGGILDWVPDYYL